MATCQISIISVYPAILESPYDNGFFTFNKKILEYDLCNFNNESWSGHVYRIAKILKCEENILQGEQFKLQSSSDKLYDEMHYEWSKDILTKSKLRNYVKFNQDIEPSGYLKISLSRFQRSLMAKLRSGILPLALETGRYYRIPIENRFCKLCQNENIEDEIHFLCCCKHFYHERLLFFTKLAETGKNIFEMSDNEKFVYIMQLNCKELPIFVETIWNKRKLILESLC